MRERSNIKGVKRQAKKNKSRHGMRVNSRGLLTLKITYANVPEASRPDNEKKKKRRRSGKRRR